MHWLHDSLGFEPSTKLLTGCTVNHSVIGIATETHSGEGSRLCALCVRAPLSNVELHVRVGEILERTTKYRPNQAFSSSAEDYDWSIDTKEGVWSPTPSFEHGRRLRTDFASLQDTSRGQAGRLVYILSLRNSPFSPEQFFKTYYISEQFYLVLRLKRKRTTVSSSYQPANMGAHDQESFKPTPPIRTSTFDSQNSVDSNELLSPTSTSSTPSPRAFLGVIAERLRERSRSRSRGDWSPMLPPPQQLSATQTRDGSQPAPLQASVKAQRPSLQENQRTSTGGSDPWRGRHSNDWLFNGFSFRDTARGAFERRRT